jgi:hypothetical protein
MWRRSISPKVPYLNDLITNWPVSVPHPRPVPEKLRLGMADIAGGQATTG